MLKNIKELRSARNVTQRQLADAIGVSQQSVNKYENHNIEPDIDMLIRIADFFETSVDYLIGHTELPHKIQACHPHDLNDTETVLIRGFRALNPKQRACILTLIDSYHGHE